MKAFIHAFVDGAAPDDIVARPVEQLYGVVLNMWKFAAKRDVGTPKIRVFNQTIEEHGWHTSHTVIQMVNDDMPFLLSSVTGNLALAGTEINFILHPIISIPPDVNENGRPEGRA